MTLLALRKTALPFAIASLLASPPASFAADASKPNFGERDHAIHRSRNVA
jgi:hypothetical protein